MLMFFTAERSMQAPSFTSPPASGIGQRVAWIVAAIQFTNALEYMAISPLFPWLASDLGVPVAWAGYAAGIYTGTAILSGLLAYFWIDRLNLRRLLMTALAVLATVTLAITLVHSFAGLMLLRAVAGLMGGLVMGGASGALLAHATPQERPALLARVVAAFSAVSIVGTPLVLWVADRWGWPWSFRLITACCLLCLLAVALFLPSHPARQQAAPAMPPGKTPPPWAHLRGKTLFYAAFNAISQLPALLLIPLLAPLLTVLAGHPDQLPLLFCAGGVAGLAASRLSGKFMPLHSPSRWFRVALLLFAANLGGTLSGLWPAWLFMLLFMASTYAALVAAAAISAAYPAPERRASFCALQAACMHLGSTLAFGASALLMQSGARQLVSYTPLLCCAALLAGGLALGIRLRPEAPATDAPSRDAS